jgi:hypothetical protein
VLKDFFSKKKHYLLAAHGFYVYWGFDKDAPMVVKKI